MNVPDNLLYTKDHEWARIEGPNAVIGITDYAQHSLGDITFVELPKIDTKAQQSKFLATVESVKAASDIYAPFSGKVVKVNDSLSTAPELINQSCYDKGWIAVVALGDVKEKANLMSAADYTKYLEGLSH
jgi:glycine cleavage system H protein